MAIVEKTIMAGQKVGSENPLSRWEGKSFSQSKCLEL
jgi:hypothetical protein